MQKNAHPISLSQQQKASWLLEPWPCLVVDNFLKADELSSAISDIDHEPCVFTIEDRAIGRIEFDVLRSHVLWRALYSKPTISLLASAFQGIISLDASNLIQMRRSNDATPEFGVHNDFEEGESTIVSLLYLSTGWTDGSGGEFLLYKQETDPYASAVIAPALNRFIAFRTLPNHWHAVSKVRNWTRLSAMALWKYNPLCCPR